MADLTDGDLAAELASFGENVSLPIKPKQRPILVKKLNHLRVRSRKQNEAAKVSQRPKLTSGRPTPSASNSRSTRYRPRPSVENEGPSNLDALSSDDSDIDAPDISQKVAADVGQSPARYSGRGRNSQLSDSVLRTLRRRTGDHRTDLSETVGSQRHRVKQADNGEARPMPSPARSSLYPDLSNFTSAFIQNSREDKFESSDSDGDEGSLYSVENKSINTSFASQSGDKEDISSRRHSYLPSPSSSSPSLDSFSSHNRRLYSGRHHANRIQPYKSRMSDFLPKILIGLVLVFFTILSLTYIILHKDFFFAWFSHSNDLGSNDNLLLCKDEVHQDCYEMPEIQKALSHVEKLFDELSAKKGRVMCEQDPEGSDLVSASILRLKIASASGSVSDTQSSRLYECCIRHILVNPHWNIRALRRDGTVADGVSEAATLESVVARMSFWCRLQRSFMAVLYGFFLLLFVIVVAVFASIYIKYRIKAKEQEQADVFNMVEKIIELLQEHHDQIKEDSSLEPAYLAVQHVRDQLLPPAKRHNLQHIWDKAVTFIASNESRIRMETKIIRGEEFDVWHWLPPSHNNGKIWQGLAFGENSLSNEIIYSPSPCLKIRNMFDSTVESEDDWEDGVVDAILEKCSSIPSILHIHVDTNSVEGCVYLKCTSCETAGKVRKALNSWWFDGRLVTVKYLKADYYQKRWPESRAATRPLKPSNNQMRSISQQMYPSSLEMT